MSQLCVPLGRGLLAISLPGSGVQMLAHLFPCVFSPSGLLPTLPDNLETSLGNGGKYMQPEPPAQGYGSKAGIVGQWVKLLLESLVSHVRVYGIDSCLRFLRGFPLE